MRAGDRTTRKRAFCELQALYEQMAPGEQSSLTHQGTTDDAEGWTAFGTEVEKLEAMSRAGLVQITLRHREAQTGLSRIDMVIFRKVAPSPSEVC